MAIYLISDTHFSHHNIINFYQRPFVNIQEMNETIIKNWNNVVTPDDIVYHLGDVAFGNSNKFHTIIQRLNGHKVLIAGNHDRRYTYEFFLKCGFEQVIGIDLDIEVVLKQKFILTHEPLETPHDGLINIHGHTHNNPEYFQYYGNQITTLDPRDTGYKKLPEPQYFNVSVEMIGYTPILLDDIEKQMEQAASDSKKTSLIALYS